MRDHNRLVTVEPNPPLRVSSVDPLEGRAVFCPRTPWEKCEETPRWALGVQGRLESGKSGHMSDGGLGFSLGVDAVAGCSARLFPCSATLSLTTWAIRGEMEEGRG